MSDSLFFILLSAIYMSQDCSKTVRQIIGVTSIALACVAMYLGK